MRHLVSILLALTASLTLVACFQHANKEESDIAGIIPQQITNEPYPASEARYSNWPDPDTLRITVNNQTCRVAHNGECLNNIGLTPNLIQTDGRLETLYYVQLKSSLFLFYSDLTSEGSSSYAQRIDLSNSKTVWKTEITGVAMARPIIRGQFVYLGLFGAVGKLKLKDGSFDWKYAELNNNGCYERFDCVSFPSAHEVLFTSPHALANDRDTLVINDLTGEILRMN